MNGEYNESNLREEVFEPDESIGISRGMVRRNITVSKGVSKSPVDQCTDDCKAG